MPAPPFALLLALLLAALLPGAPALAIDWSERERRTIQQFNRARLGPPPHSPGNRVADDPRAAALGRRLFFDPRLSGDGRISCASCHQPMRWFTDGRARARGAGQLGRNALGLSGAAWQRWFYWDGRRDSLWAQALVPIEAADEMGGSRSGALRTVLGDPALLAQYRAVFGPPPAALDGVELPTHAGPISDEAGRRAWDALPRVQRRAIDTAYANIGKAIAAWERTLAVPRTALDAYLEALAAGAADSDAIPAPAKAGLRLFIDPAKTQCLQCHNGPLLSTGDFHNIGTGRFDGEALDFGRALGIPAIELDRFNCLGEHSDADPEQCTALRFMRRHGHVPMQGAYRAPSLRLVAETGPWFHDGRAERLADVLAHYREPPDPRRAGAHELRPLTLDDKELVQLEAFLHTLSPLPGEQPIATP